MLTMQMQGKEIHYILQQVTPNGLLEKKGWNVPLNGAEGFHFPFWVTLYTKQISAIL